MNLQYAQTRHDEDRPRLLLLAFPEHMSCLWFEKLTYTKPLSNTRKIPDLHLHQYLSGLQLSSKLLAQLQISSLPTLLDHLDRSFHQVHCISQQASNSSEKLDSQPTTPNALCEFRQLLHVNTVISELRLVSHTFMCALVIADVVSARLQCSNSPLTYRRPDVNCTTCQLVRLVGDIARTILLLNDILVQPWCKVSKGIHCHDLLWIGPLWEWSDIFSWFGVGKIRSSRNQLKSSYSMLILCFYQDLLHVVFKNLLSPVINLDFTTCHCQSIVDRV